MPDNARLLPLTLAALWCLPSACVRPIEGPSGRRPVENVETIEELWPNGQLRLRKQVLREPDGTLLNHGTYIRWYKNGQQEEYRASFRWGKKRGTSTLWHRNGKKWTEEHHVDGTRHGVRNVWDEAGMKRAEEYFDHGKPHGTWTEWRADGEIRWQQRFEHGTPVP